jgi:peptidoglycan-associated lipoprotein
MRLRFKHTFALLCVIAAISTAPVFAQAAPTAGKPSRAELALDYNWVHSNAPPGGCECFSLNGGSATFAWLLKPSRFALVGDITASYGAGISTSNYGLTLSAYTAGVRYLPRVGHTEGNAHVQPFGQALVGVAHASGTLVEGQNAGASNSNAAFAAHVGGGLDLPASRRFSVRLVEADYLLTTFDNGSNDHQNNLRIGAGVVIHF